jgi:hypothetical protein
MKRWSEFAREMPAMAEAGRTLIYQYKVGLGYLATVRKDGAPRVHPVCPVLANDGLYVFIGNQTPKLKDLLRDGRYALHTFPVAESDDEFTVSGRAISIDDTAVRKIVHDTYTATGATTSNDTLFELLLDRALHAKYGPRPSWPPKYTSWRSEP